MKRLLVSILMLSLACHLSHAESRFRVNAEWGCSAAFATDHIFQYRANDGSLVLDYGPFDKYIGTGFVTLGAGATLGRHFYLSLNSGYMGVCPESEIIPLLLKFDWKPGDADRSGFLAFVEGGTGFHTVHTGDMPVLARMGAGWKLVLNDRTSLDARLSLRYILDHPAVQDYSTLEIVDPSRVIRSEARLGTVSFSISLNF